MIIRESQQERNSSRRRKIFSRRNVLLTILLLLAAGLFVGDRQAKQKGFSGLFSFSKVVISNYWNSRDAGAEEISIEIKDKSLRILETNRQKALKRGVIINDLDGEFVPATLTYAGKKMNVKLRLKGHMTDHLQEDKWSFRIKMKGKDDFMGMKRFTIQHPGTRGYVYEWIYHELMKQADIIALRYKFINVTVNGKDWGIYAVEENFENDLLENNGRPRGPIIRFDPDLYWVNRYNMMLGMASHDEFASYYSSNAVAYREDDILKDTAQKKLYLEALAVFEGVRSRKLAVAKAFDIDRLAKFHAIIDLVGGQHSIDWSDIKYYYNPRTRLLEPVAYESFSNFPVTHLSAAYKFSIPDSAAYHKDWHSTLFSDTVFFSAYVRELERISQPAYLDKFFASVQPALKTNLGILYKEFPYKQFSSSVYYQNQKMIAHMLDTPQGVKAYFDGLSGEQGKYELKLHVASIESLPMEITGVRLSGCSSKRVSSILPAHQQGQFVKYTELRIPVGCATVNPDSIMLLYRIPGSSREKTVKVFPYEYVSESRLPAGRVANAGTQDYLKHIETEQGHAFIFPPGKTVINSDLVLPRGSTLVASSGSVIELRNNASIYTEGSLNFKGSAEDPVRLVTSGINNRIEVTSKMKSTLDNVLFEGSSQPASESGFLIFYNSEVMVESCVFIGFNVENVLSLSQCEFTIRGCSFEKTSDDAIEISFSKGSVQRSAFISCRENALDITRSVTTIKSLVISDSSKVGILLKDGSQLIGSDVSLRNVKSGIRAENASTAQLTRLTMKDCNTGIEALQTGRTNGFPEVLVSELKMTNVKNSAVAAPGCRILIDGKETKTVESIAKKR
jgi:hypothetical protein